MAYNRWSQNMKEITTWGVPAYIGDDIKVGAK